MPIALSTVGNDLIDVGTIFCESGGTREEDESDVRGRIEATYLFNGWRLDDEIADAGIMDQQNSYL